MEKQSFLGDRMGGTLRKPVEFIRCWASYSEDINDSELDDDDNKLEALDKESYNNFHGFADKPMVYAQALLRPDEFSVPPVNMLTRKDETLRALLCWTGLRYMYIVYSESAFCVRDRLEEEIMKVEIFDNQHWNAVKDRLLLNML